MGKSSRMIDGEREDERFLWAAWMPLVAAVAPFGAWMIEQVLPFPQIIEEVMKWYMVKKARGIMSGRAEWMYMTLLGFMFAGSETLLYIVAVVGGGQLSSLIWRVLLTIPMHITTILVAYAGWRKNLPWWGLGLAILIHWGFNWAMK